MPIGLNNPLLRRVKRYQQFSVLFRAVDYQRPPSSAIPFVPAIQYPAQRQLRDVIPVETSLRQLDPQLTIEEAVARSEAAPPKRTLSQKTRLQRSTGVETQPAAVSAGVPARVIPDGSPPLKSPITKTEDVQPLAESKTSEETKSISDDDWGGDWARLKKVLSSHQELQAKLEESKESEVGLQAKTESKPKRLSDVQKRESRPPRVPKPDERRPAKIEYIKPDQEVEPRLAMAELAEVPKSESYEIARDAPQIEEETEQSDLIQTSAEPDRAIRKTEASADGVKPKDQEESGSITPDTDMESEAEPVLAQRSKQSAADDASGPAVEVRPLEESEAPKQVFSKEPADGVKGDRPEPSSEESAPAAISPSAEVVDRAVQKAEALPEPKSKPKETPRSETEVRKSQEKLDGQLQAITDDKPEAAAEVDFKDTLSLDAVDHPAEETPAEPPDRILQTSPAGDHLQAAIQRAEASSAESASTSTEKPEPGTDLVSKREPALDGSEEQPRELGVEPEPAVLVRAKDEIQEARAPDVPVRRQEDIIAEAIRRAEAPPPAEIPALDESADRGEITQARLLEPASEKAEPVAPTGAQFIEGHPSPPSVMKTDEKPAEVRAAPEPDEGGGLGRRLLDRVQRLFSREQEPTTTEKRTDAPGIKQDIAIQRAIAQAEAPPERAAPTVVKATLAKPLEAPAFTPPAPKHEVRAPTPAVVQKKDEAQVPKAMDAVKAEIIPSDSAELEQLPPGGPPASPIYGDVDAALRFAEEQPQPADSAVMRREESTDTSRFDVDDGGEAETIIAPTPDFGVEGRPPLEEAWEVRRIEPDIPQPVEGERDITPKVKPTGPVVQRKTAGGDSSADQIDRALRQVAPEVESDSAIELVTPRRPRPQPRPIEQAARNEEIEAAVQKVEMPEAMQPAAEAAADHIQRQPTAIKMPAPASPAVAPKPAAPVTAVPETKSPQTEGSEGSPAPSVAGDTGMVPTEVGDLPSDFWRLIGQQPPLPTPGPTTGDQVQRAIANAEAGVSVAEAPQLQDVVTKEWGPQVVQRVETRQAPQQLEQRLQPEQDTSELAAAERGPDIDMLAKQVYAQLKRKLAIERERNRGRF